MGTKKKIRMIILSIFTFSFITLIAWAVLGNKALELNSYTISSPNLPNNFSGYRIAHVSDFHNTELDKITESFSPF